MEGKRKCVEILGLLIQNAPNNQEKSPASKILSAEYLLLLVLLYIVDVYIIINDRSITSDNNVDLIVLYQYDNNIMTVQKSNSYRINLKSIKKD